MRSRMSAHALTTLANIAPVSVPLGHAAADDETIAVAVGIIEWLQRFRSSNRVTASATARADARCCDLRRSRDPQIAWTARRHGRDGNGRAARRGRRVGAPGTCGIMPAAPSTATRRL